jgi:tetratricopeptide (TPR) repeat protein
MARYDLAVADFNRVLAIEPRDIGAVIDRGKIFVKAGQLAAAISDFDRAVDMDKGASGMTAAAIRERGLAYKQMGNFSAARSDLNSYIRLHPEDPEIVAALNEIEGTPSTLPPPTPIPPRAINPAPLPSPTGSLGGTVVPMVSNGGTFTVPVTINGQLTLNFIVDSGASDVSIPADVVMTLVRTGTITDADFLGKKSYRMADGSTLPSQQFLIRSLKVGDKVLENVTGSIAPVAGSLLLGQSFLTRFNSWSIDNHRQALILN